MVGYAELAKLSTFSMADVEALTANRHTAHSMVRRLMRNGLVQKIRSNLYSCVSVETGQVIASRYHIASGINKTAYVSHHTTFEFHGVANQVYHEVFVSSKSRFAGFDFEGITYRFILSRFDDGVIEPSSTEGIRVTDLERTAIVSMKDFGKAGGLDELLRCLDMLTFLDEYRLRNYVDRYGLQFLYQKTGYILEHYQEALGLSAGFFDYCMDRVGKSTRYLLPGMSNNGVYNPRWRLVVPRDLFSMYERGGDALV